MVSGTFGRVFFGAVADRIGALYTYFVASLMQTVMVFWFTQSETLIVLHIIAAIFGFGFSGVMTSLLICAREAAPLRMAGFAASVISGAAWLGMGIGSYQGGYFYDLTGSYAWSYGNAAIAGIVNLVILAALILYRKKQHELLPVGASA